MLTAVKEMTNIVGNLLPVEPAPRPQSLMLTFLGEHLYGTDRCVFSGSVIDVLARFGVTEHATRSTLARMVNRGLLRRQRDGRRMYFGLTPRCAEVLADGQRRIWHTSAVNDDWDGGWTLLGFSLPESWQRQRHELRSRLVWAGFGPLQGGLWLAPSGADLTVVAGDRELAAHLRVFQARALPPTDVDALVRDAWDLDAVAARYRGFLERWEAPARRPRLPDSLAQQLALQTDWLQVIRRDPRLPVQHLPEGWPAERAQDLFYALNGEYDEGARAIAARLDVVPEGAPAGG